MKQLYKITFLLILLINSGFVLNAKNNKIILENKIENKISKSILAPPTASISGTTAVCQNAPSPQITFTGSNGTAPYTFTYTISGVVGNQTITTTSGNSVNVSVPTTNTGVFVYTLVSVSDISGNQARSGSATVTVGSPPTVNFTFNNNDTCSGTAIQFNSSVSGTGTIIYSWDFGDGTPLSNLQNPTHEFIALGCGTSTFSVTLTITVNGCTVTRTQTILVRQKPNISFSDLNNSFDPFNNCSNAASNPVFSINVGNTSSNLNCVSSYTIDWGDGSAITTNASFPAGHTYNLVGAYNMVITALGTNGCSNSITYVIKNVTNPSGGIVSPGSTQNLCTPTAPLNFTISNWGANSSGTVYNIDYGDGSPIVLLTQADLQSSVYYNASNPSASLNFPIPYSYTTSNCPSPRFTALLTVSNACGETPSSVSNITVYSRPTASFTSPPEACLNTSVSFTNTTLTGYNQNCVQNALYQWDFGDGTTSILVNPTHTYTASGNYTVTLTAQGYCGFSDPITRTICIEPPLVPQFTLNNNAGCMPMAITTTNTTVATNSCSPPTYVWSVGYAPAFCGTTIAPIPNQTTTNASFNFVEAGTYTITLTATNSCSPPQIISQTVTVKKPPTITAINGIVDNYCGPVTINPTATINSCAPASSTLTYAWSFPGGTPATSASEIPGAINYSTAGDYTVSLIVTNECGASTTATRSFTINDVPVVTNTPLTQTICSGSTTSLVNLISSVTGTTFSWTATATTGISGFTPSGTSTIPVQTISTTNTIPGTVTYAITPSSGGCSGAVTNYVITVNPAPTITQPASSTICLGGTPNVLSVTVTGATGTPQYQWYSNGSNNTTTGTLIPGETNNTYNPPSSTVGIVYYYCIITLPSGGCSSITTNTAEVNVQANTTITIQPRVTQNLCVGVTTATPLSIVASGSGNITYQWYSNTVNSNTGGALISGATSASYTPPVFTIPNNYYYYVTASLTGNGCSPVASDVAEIIVDADPTISLQPIVSQTLCQSATPVNLEVAATGGNGIFGYQWYRNSTNSNTGGTLITGEINTIYTPSTTAVGTEYYYCVVSQSTLGCSVTSATAQISIISAPTITQPASSIICLGQTPTLLSITVSGATGTPQYQWHSNIANDTSNGTAITGAVNNTYNPPATTVGTIYYYCIITLPTGGCSSLTSNTATVTINQNPVISNKTSIICSGRNFTILPVNSGSEIVPAGTVYTWSNPTISPSNSITGALAESTPQTEISQTLINTTTSPATVTYTVTPVSGNCPGNTFTIIVTVNPAISSNVTSTNSTCFGANNGILQTNITGGIPFSSGSAYTISWTGPNGFTSSSSSISNLAPGIYNLSITDQGGCPIDETYSITEPDDIIITTNLERDISCFNAADGEIAITITGGSLNYTIAWTKDGAPYAITEDLNNLSPGIYTVSVSDANNCGPKTATFTITEPPILAVSLGNQTNILCFGQSTGAINVNVTGGTSPYTFAWTGPNGFTSPNEDLTTLFAGTYNLTVTDNFNCSRNLSVILTQTPEIIITATTTPIVCYGDNNASINLVITGGVSPYQIGWSNLATGTFQNNLSAGDYLITVTDALNCVQTLNVNIPEAPIFTVNPVVNNISCFGANNGSINLNFVGGIAPINLTWSDGSTAGTSRNNLGPGSYTVTIIDSKPCTIVRTFTILEPQPLVLSANLTNALDCNDANTGAINLLVSGGSAPFTYSWSNGVTTEDLNNIPAGNYMITVTDVNGCTKQAQYSINRPPPLVATVITNTDFNCETKYVSQTFVASVSGGLPPYQLIWSSGTITGANNEIMNTSQNGTVILDVTDALGCKTNYTFDVETPVLGIPSFDTDSYGFSTLGKYSIKDPIQFNNTATGDFIGISWDFGDGTFSTEINPVHQYVNPKDYVVTQTVTYPFGCVYIHKITLTVEKGYVLVLPTAFTPNNDNFNDNFRPVAKSLKNIRLDIYDTWGSLIYSETGDVLRGWDGKIKGFKAENGNYYCKVSGETFYGATINENHPFVLIK